MLRMLCEPLMKMKDDPLLVMRWRFTSTIEIRQFEILPRLSIHLPKGHKPGVIIAWLCFEVEIYHGYLIA